MQYIPVLSFDTEGLFNDVADNFGEEDEDLRSFSKRTKRTVVQTAIQN